MKHRPTKPDGILQLFAIPTGSKATCVRARYVQGRISVETRTNSFYITDTKHTLMERCARGARRRRRGLCSVHSTSVACSRRCAPEPCTLCALVVLWHAMRGYATCARTSPASLRYPCALATLLLRPCSPYCGDCVVTALSRSPHLLYLLCRVHTCACTSVLPPQGGDV